MRFNKIQLINKIVILVYKMMTINLTNLKAIILFLAMIVLIEKVLYFLIWSDFLLNQLIFKSII